MADRGRVGTSEEPREARIITVLLQALGVEECEPLVHHQLMELMHRYASQVFQEARIFADHAGRTDVELDDIKLAIQSRVNVSFVQPPPREFLENLAAERNKLPLPTVPEGRSYVRLPPDRFCMTAPNYDLVPKARPAQSAPATPATDFTTSAPVSINVEPVVIKPVQATLRPTDAMDVDDDYDAPLSKKPRA